MKKNLIVIIAILMICSYAAVSFATDLNSLEEKRNEITNQIENANVQLNEVQEELSNTVQEIQDLDVKIEQYETEVKSLSTESTELKVSITELEEKLKVSEENYKMQKQLSQERLENMYMKGETSYLDVLLGSSSISEFLSNYYLLSEITKIDMQQLEYIEKEKNEIEANKKSLEEQKERLKTVKNNRERTSIVLENTKVLRNQYLASLTETEKQLQTQIEEYEAQIAEVEAEILLLTVANLDSEYTGRNNGMACTWVYKDYVRVWDETSSNT